MAHRSRRLLGIAAGLGLGILALSSAALLRDAEPHGTPVSWPAAAARLLALFGVGRLLLSLLPSGPIGAHAPRDLPTTWAASHLLGLVALHLQAVLFQALGWETSWAVWLPWAALLAARLLTLPAALVPGHEVAGERSPLATGALGAGLLLWTILLVHLGRPLLDAPTTAVLVTTDRLLGDATGTIGALHAFSWLAAWLLLAEGLRRARRAPAGIALLVASVALLVVRLPGASLSLVFSIAALSLLTPWLRRADRRALALAALCFSACAASGAGWVSLAGAFAVVAAGRAGQRPEALRTSLLGLLVVALPGWLHWRNTAPGVARAHFTPVEELGSALTSGSGLAWMLFLLLVGATLVVRRREARRRAPTLSHALDVSGDVTPPSAEIRSCLLWIASGTCLAGPWSVAFHSGVALAHLFPAGALLAGLSLIRAERPHGEGSA